MNLLKNCQLLGAVTPPDRKPGLLDLCRRLDYDPDQPREENGQWGETGAGGSKSGRVKTEASGKHAHRIKDYSGSAITEHVLSDLRSHEAKALESRPLVGIKVVDGLISDELEGDYSFKDHEIRLAGGPINHGEKYDPGRMFGVSDVQPDETSAKQAVYHHELGHVIMGRTGGDEAEIIDKAFGEANHLTEYGKVSAQEYFAESHAAYIMMPDRQLQDDPVGYRMVEAVLKAKGLL